MDLYEFEDYRDAIGEIIAERKKIITDLTFQYIAEECRIQKGYFSRVLQGRADLSRDQLFLWFLPQICGCKSHVAA